MHPDGRTMDFNAGSSVGRRWAEPLAASGQLHGRHWAGSHGRRQGCPKPCRGELASRSGEALGRLFEPHRVLNLTEYCGVAPLDVDLRSTLRLQRRAGHP